MSEQASAPSDARAIEINGRRLDAGDLQIVHRLEAQLGPIPDGRYWYDPISGGAGLWGGPAAAYLGAGLRLGGPLPATASGGGDGRLTGTFVNGRELHPLDVQGLSQYGPVARGRFWWDAHGNVGYEGFPMPLFNFYAVAAQRQGSNSTSRRSRNGQTWVGGGAAVVHGKLGDVEYSYYSGFD